ncbi:MAG TPA: SCO family protein [Vicinamibacterales bacterium]|nr:SCO family protein [Vicinamibacterales bacterium]
MRMRTAFSLVLTLLAPACGGTSHPGDRREYTLQGQVLSVQADHRQAVIRHEEITGFMSAMTMPYDVTDPKEYEAVAPGDLITARLIVEPNRAYLEQVKKVGTAPLEGAPAAAAAASGFELIATGAPVPNQTFVNQDGTSVTLDSFRGNAVIVTFTYTSCPMPTMCPLMDRNFATIQAKLKEQNNLLKTHLLSVSFDPDLDTPAVLKKHAASLGADPRLWSFVTGKRDEIDKWASGFGVSISRAMNDPSDITHNLRTALLDRQGNLVQVYTGNEWTPEQLLADVRVMVGID